MNEQPSAMRGTLRPLRDCEAHHFLWTTSDDGRVAAIRLNRPNQKGRLSFDSSAGLRDLGHVSAIVLTGSGGNSCYGGDVFEIIEPLTRAAFGGN